jgi:hypothetical protein
LGLRAVVEHGVSAFKFLSLIILLPQTIWLPGLHSGFLHRVGLAVACFDWKDKNSAAAESALLRQTWQHSCTRHGWLHVAWKDAKVERVDEVKLLSIVR